MASRAPGYLRAHCEVGGILAERVGLGDSVVRGLLYLFEEWDGTGPNGLRVFANSNAVITDS